MKKIKTKMGVIYNQGLNFYDSKKRYLLGCLDVGSVRHFIKSIKSFNSVEAWLSRSYEDVCWGTFADIVNFARDYQLSNGRVFDRDWVVDNYNKIGDTYILFNYSDAFK